ncbi:hypothetical protein [Flavisphingomonas formosensis]|nr:hypothetical protein [Sphingomonas formosensis]
MSNTCISVATITVIDNSVRLPLDIADGAGMEEAEVLTAQR